MEKRLLQDIVDKIVAGISPEKVILFGSQAYGKTNEDSDIDLLVIWDTSLVGAERIRHISRLLTPRPAPIDIVVRTPAEIRHAASRVEPFLTEILHKGVIAYERR